LTFTVADDADNEKPGLVPGFSFSSQEKPPPHFANGRFAKSALRDCTPDVVSLVQES
jgi:hypothetical protein